MPGRRPGDLGLSPAPGHLPGERVGVVEGVHRLTPIPIPSIKVSCFSTQITTAKYKEGIAPPQPQKSLCTPKLRAGRFHQGNDKPQATPQKRLSHQRHIFSLFLRHMVTPTVSQVPFKVPGTRRETETFPVVIKNLPVQGTWVRSLVQKDATRCSEAKSMHHNY